MDAGIFAGLAEEKGISSELPVVVYDGGRSGSMFAARVWWALKCHGHPKPLILAGGWKAWVDSGGEEQLYEPCPLKVMAEYDCSPNFQWYADKAAMLRVVEDNATVQGDGVQILDVRSAAQYDGTVQRSERAGRIPGAISLPYKHLLDGDVLQTPEQLEVTMEQSGLDLSREITIYCNGGVSACVAAAALDSLGNTRWRVHDGSWNEWGNDESVPIEA